jgi:hypothetical protein
VKTDCAQTQLRFQELGSREVVASFDAGHVTSDAGALLLREVLLRSELVSKFAACFVDGRDRRYVVHRLEQLIAQRVVGIALGYEDVSDHDALRHDPMMALLAERDDLGALGGKSTINRLEQGGRVDRYQKITWAEEKMADLLVESFLSQFREVPQSLVLDFDATDTVLHGQQEGRFFHGYYGHYCYLPLYVTCGSHILCALLRRSNQDASAGTVEQLVRIVAAIRRRFPEVQIIARGDSGFARDPLMDWCEANGVYYVFGLARNVRLEEEIKAQLESARAQFNQTGNPARRFKDFVYQTLDSWTRERRVVGKAEHLEKGSNPRFIVTNLPVDSWAAQPLYEKLYCARGDMENRIKEHQNDMFGHQMSTHTMRSNQLRLYFSTIAYMLVNTLRHEALAGTELERAQPSTIRLKLLKIGALVTVSVRRICIRMASGYPYQQLFAQALDRLKLMRLSPA